MKSFNVIWWDFNKKEPEPYDIIPYLVDCYKETKLKDKPKTFEEFKSFIEKQSIYEWWGRCQYEILIERWPPRSNKDESIKWDIHKQVMMNIDNITNILMEVLKK